MRHVPNGPSGEAGEFDTGFFHRRFGLPARQRVILQAGALEPEMLALEIASACATWPVDWSLVMHERRSVDLGKPYIRQVAEASRGRALLSLQPVPYDRLDDVFGSADVSLVLYSSAHGDNYRLVSSASGKLAHSLRTGTPVICLDTPGMRELVDRYGCGLVVGRVEDVADAVRRILDDREAFSARARACYREAFEFGRQFAPVLDEIEAMTRCRSDA